MTASSLPLPEEPGRRFAFGYAHPWHLLLRAVGLGPRCSAVTVDDASFTARLGWCVVRTPLANLSAIHVTGPYATFKALGVRGSRVDGGLTLGTNADRGVCVCFHRPVPVGPWGRPHCTAVTVTVTDPNALAAALAAVTA